jgi:hypothetical protein
MPFFPKYFDNKTIRTHVQINTINTTSLLKFATKDEQKNNHTKIEVFHNLI